MKTNNKQLVQACINFFNDNDKLPNYMSQIFKYKSKDYVYMAEVDPHVDDWSGSEKVWSVVFHAIKEDYVFIYRHGGVLHKIEPELGKIYTFDFTKYHALLHKDNVQYFHKRKFWETFEAEPELVCIFEFIEE